MDSRQLYIAAYDVADPQRLREALLVLRNYATGGQKSVFECFLTPAEKAALLAEVREVLAESEDRFLLFRVDPRAPALAMGIGVVPSDPSFLYIG